MNPEKEIETTTKPSVDVDINGEELVTIQVTKKELQNVRANKEAMAQQVHMKGASLFISNRCMKLGKAWAIQDTRKCFGKEIPNKRAGEMDQMYFVNGETVCQQFNLAMPPDWEYVWVSRGQKNEFICLQRKDNEPVVEGCVRSITRG